MTEVALRLARQEDLSFVSALASDPTVAPFLTPDAQNPEQLREFWLQRAIEDGPGGLYLIERSGDGPVGAMGLGVASARSQICALTRLMVDPAVRRQGVGLSAVRAACQLVLVERGFHRVQAETYGENAAGRRLFEAAGFTLEGIRRRAYRWPGGWADGALYGILADEL